MRFPHIAVSFFSAKKTMKMKCFFNEKVFPIISYMAQPYFISEASSYGETVLHICVSKYFIIIFQCREAFLCSTF